MENAFTGTIMAVAYNFPPYGWQVCNGQLLDIRAYPALYSLLGNMYGGTAGQTFALPDLRGYTVIGAGPSVASGRTLPLVEQGTAIGANTVNAKANSSITLAIGTANLPNVPISGALNTGGLTATSTLNATQTAGGGLTPQPGAILCNSGTGNASANIYYVNPTPATPLPAVALNSASVQTQIGTTGTFTSAPLGSGTPLTAGNVTTTTAVPTTQPSLGLTYIICVEGSFPTRN